MLLKNKFYQQNITLLLIICSSLAVAVAVDCYCQIFSDFVWMAHQRLSNHPLLFLFFTPLFFWASAFLCRKLAPQASGSSLDNVKNALEQLNKSPEKTTNLLNFRVAMVTIVGSLLCVFGGGALGREGPSIQISASFFAALCQRFKKTLVNINLENWIFVGIAIGLAASFNAPIAGLVYVAEKLLKNKCYNFQSNIFWSMIAMMTFVLFLQKPYSLFTTAPINFELNKEVFLIFLTSVVCGLLALVFKDANRFLYHRLWGIKSRYWHLVPIICGLAVASISLYCGIYSFGGGIKTTQDALSSSTNLLSYKEVGGRIVNTMLTFASGSVGGLVAPSMTIGSGVGSIMASFFVVINSKLLMLGGMAAFLAVVFGEPFTAALIVFEVTNQPISNLTFLIFSTLVSIFTAKAVKSSYCFLKTQPK